MCVMPCDGCNRHGQLPMVAIGKHKPTFETYSKRDSQALGDVKPLRDITTQVAEKSTFHVTSRLGFLSELFEWVAGAKCWNLGLGSASFASSLFKASGVSICVLYICFIILSPK